MRGWRNWQTRHLEVVVPARAWRFKSSPAHQMISSEIGILFSILALIFWGVGDFLIQKSVRKIGDWESLFVISFIGLTAIFPFIYQDIYLIFENSNLLIFCFISTTFLIASLIGFESYKVGKISIVEPIQVVEIPVSGLLAYFFLKEGINPFAVVVIILLMIGLVSLSLKNHHLKRHSWVEKGVFLAIISSLFMGSANFLIAFTSRITNPLLVVWFFNFFITMITLIYLLFNHDFFKLLRDISEHKKFLLSVGILDNLAWICFAFAVSIIPVAIAVVLSESYIALAVILGVLINKEILTKHQIAGIFITIPSAILLALLI